MRKEFIIISLLSFALCSCNILEDLLTPIESSGTPSNSTGTFEPIDKNQDSSTKTTGTLKPIKKGQESATETSGTLKAIKPEQKTTTKTSVPNKGTIIDQSSTTKTTPVLNPTKKEQRASEKVQEIKDAKKYAELYTKLKLSDYQKKKFDALNLKYKAELTELRSKTGRDRMKTGKDKEIKSFLSEAQFTKYKDLSGK